MQAASTFLNSYDSLITLPLAMLAWFGVGVFFLERLLPARDRWLSGCAALVGIAITAAAVFKIQIEQTALEARGLPVPTAFFGTVIVDRFALYFFYLLLSGAALCILIRMGELRTEAGKHGTFYSLVLFSLIGMMAMTCGNNVLLLFVALELTALCAWLLAIMADRGHAEASLRYVLSSAFSSALFVFGLAFLYGVAGSTSLDFIGQSLAMKDPHSAMVILALIFSAAGLLFKVGAAPFHSWTTGVWRDLPASVVGVITVLATIATWAMLLRIFARMFYALRPIYLPALVAAALVSMVLGSVLALFERNPRGVLAYAAVAHMGFLMLGLIAGPEHAVSLEGLRGTLFYLAAYAIATVGALAIFARLPYGSNRDWEGVGFETHARWEFVLLIVFLASLAGIPPLAGFHAKFSVFRALLGSGHTVAAIAAMLCATVSALAYFRLARSFFVPHQRLLVSGRAVFPVKTALVATAAAAILFGIFPAWPTRAVDWALSVPRVAAPAAHHGPR